MAADIDGSLIPISTQVANLAHDRLCEGQQGGQGCAKNSLRGACAGITAGVLSLYLNRRGRWSLCLGAGSQRRPPECEVPHEGVSGLHGRTGQRGRLAPFPSLLFRL